jgi:hypothetical protein
MRTLTYGVISTVVELEFKPWEPDANRQPCADMDLFKFVYPYRYRMTISDK